MQAMEGPFALRAISVISDTSRSHLPKAEALKSNMEQGKYYQYYSNSML